MGSCGSKEPSSAVKYVWNPMTDNGMGCIGKGIEEVNSGKKTVAVMLGNWEIAPSRLDFENQVNIGEGRFGVVLETTLQKVDAKGAPIIRVGEPVTDHVIIKKLSLAAEREDKTNFFKEMQALKEVEHPHVLKLLGVMTVEPPLAMIFESPSNGVLKSFLANSRHMSGTLLPQHYVSFASSISDAMVYLHEKEVVHKDLSTRNCMITGDYVVKVGDYGLSRVKFPHDYYAFEGMTIPIRWMAPESISDKKVSFTREGDYWSFGVTLWEIYSFGNLPYPSLTNAEVLPQLLQGKSLDPPKGMPEELLEMYGNCFSKDPSKRPTFKDFVTVLGSLTEDFPNYSGLGRSIEDLSKIDDEPPPPQPRNANSSRSSTVSVYGADHFTPPSPTRLVSSTPSQRSFRQEALPEVQETEYVDPQRPAKSSPDKYDNTPVIDSSLPPQHAPQQHYQYNMRSLLQYMDSSAPSALNKLEKRDVTDIPREKLVLQNELGHGAFGVVYKGVLQLTEGKPQFCAVKTLKENAGETEVAALLAEAYIVTQFRHKNVISCIGQVCSEKETLILFEFMEKGSLFSYLKSGNEPSLERKMKMAIDIADGMQYLAFYNHVHRDMAARNILVAGDLTCKISDFGLSRNLEDEMYYESDGGLVPIRWTPPEAYKYKKYSSASDVWSFGVLLYELWTQAALPYGKNWTNFQVMSEVERGYRMPPPPNCPKAIYSLMIDCWHPQRASRPSFKTLYDKIVTAHDMLFSALDTKQAAKIDTDYGSLKEVYLGVPVPSFEELESESAYLEPTPLHIQNLGPSASDLDQQYGSPTKPVDFDQNKKEYAAVKDALSPNAPAVLHRLLNALTYEDVKDKNRASNAYMMQRQNSLRKQRVASETPHTDDSEPARLYSVAEMKKISEEREKISKVEKQGILNVERAFGTTNIVEKREFIENVGRAREVEEVKAIKGRKKCICRRAKCVCKFDEE